VAVIGRSTRHVIIDDRRDARKNRWLDRGSSAYDFCAVMINLLERHDCRRVHMHEFGRRWCTSETADIDAGASEEEGAAPASMSGGDRPVHRQPPAFTSAGV
jgi:hypothetical protein